MAHLAFGEKKTIDDVWPVRNKRFFVRTDYESLMEHGMNQPPSPLLNTIMRIICQGGKAVIACSFGTFPSAPDMKLSPERRLQNLQAFPRHLSTCPLVGLLKKLLPDGTPVDFAEDCLCATDLVNNMQSSSVVVLENLRLYRNELSSDLDERMEFATVLSGLSDVFVNDVFATSHLHAAGAVELPKIVRHGACGTLMEQEMLYFSKMLINPPRPTTLVLGSVHIEEKLNLLEALIRKVDKVLLGSAVAIPFLELQGVQVGKYSPMLTSEETPDKIRWTDTKQSLRQCCRKLMHQAERYNVQLVFPLDFVAHDTLDPTRFPTITTDQAVPDDLMVVDIGPKTIQLYNATIRDSRTIFWTGRMGCAAHEDYTSGTTAIATAIGHSNAISVVGGKNTVRFCKDVHVEDNISHLSTGPNAMLRVLQGTPLPALSALSDAHPAIADDIQVSVHALFRHCTLFKQCTTKQLRSIVSHAVPRTHATGDVIMHEGDRFSSMFIVARGHLTAMPKVQQGKTTAGRVIAVGESIGEWEFLTTRVCQELVQAASDDTVTYQLSASALEEAFNEMTTLAPQLLRCASEPLRVQQNRERSAEASEWAAVSREMKDSRKPMPWGRPSTIVNTITAAVTSLALHKLTLVLAPFERRPGTCVIAQPYSGAGMRTVHGIFRELVYAKLTPKLGSTGAAVASSAMTVPFRLAATGVPFHRMSAATVIHEGLAAGAMSCVPRAVHALFLFNKSAAEVKAFRDGRRLGWFRELSFAMLCRIIGCILCLPLVIHRPSSGVTSIAVGATRSVAKKYLLVYGLKQILGLLLEIACHKVLAPAPQEV